MSTYYFKELSDRVMDAAFTVHRIVGAGFLESVYEDCMCIELKLLEIGFERQKTYSFSYKGRYAGGYVADLVVENKIILELKSVTSLNNLMSAQLINYLKVSGLKVGYLLNFNNIRLEWRRFVV